MQPRLKDMALKYTHISEVLPYMAYKEDERIYIHDGGLAATVFELSPSIIAADTTAFESILDLLVPGAIIQFTLYGSPNITYELDAFAAQKERAKEDPLYGALIENYVKFLDNKTKDRINNLMETQLKNHRLFVSIVMEKHIDRLSIISESIENILSTKGYYPRSVKPAEFHALIYEILNMNHDFRDIPEYDDRIPLARQMLAPDTLIDTRDKEYVVSDGVYWSSLEPVHFPNETNIWMFSSRLGDYLTANIDKQQFYTPFIITASFSMVPNKKSSGIKGRQAVTVGQNLPENLIPRAAKKKVDALHTIKGLEEKKKLVTFSLNVLVSGKSRKEAKRTADIVKSYWDSGMPQQRIKLEQVARIVPVNFFCSLPAAMNSEYYMITENYTTFFTDEAAQFIPSEADWSGTKTPTIPLISRRGQLIEFDLFDSPDNYNGYIVATSGAGKSVLINYLTLLYLAKGDTVFTFDIGRSYEKLCESIGGQWIEFDLNNPISINPFSEIKTQTDFDENWEYLRDFIYFIGASLSKDYSDQVEKLIKSYIDGALKELWSEYKEKLEITHIAEWFLGSEDRELKNFGQQLTPYTSTGIYGKFFTGKSSVDFHKPYVVMELDTIENMQELRDAVIMIMI
ncbi:MAG: TraC family protein, partial [bacterium]